MKNGTSSAGGYPARETPIHRLNAAPINQTGMKYRAAVANADGAPPPSKRPKRNAPRSTNPPAITLIVCIEPPPARASPLSLPHIEPHDLAAPDLEPPERLEVAPARGMEVGVNGGAGIGHPGDRRDPSSAGAE